MSFNYTKTEKAKVGGADGNNIISGNGNASMSAGMVRMTVRLDPGSIVDHTSKQLWVTGRAVFHPILRDG